MNCIRCNAEVCADRVEFLTSCHKPVTCVSCSSELPKVCLFDYSHKTAGSLVVVGTDAEQIRLARRVYCRSR